MAKSWPTITHSMKFQIRFYLEWNSILISFNYFMHDSMIFRSCLLCFTSCLGVVQCGVVKLCYAWFGVYIYVLHSAWSRNMNYFVDLSMQHIYMLCYLYISLVSAFVSEIVNGSYYSISYWKLLSHAMLFHSVACSSSV